MGTFEQDLIFALRMMRKNLGFTAAAVLCLMLGIGATTGIFTVVNAVLLRPLPYLHPEQLVRIYTEFPTFPNGGLHRFWTSGPEFFDLRRDLKSWESIDLWANTGVNIAGNPAPGGGLFFFCRRRFGALVWLSARGGLFFSPRR